ncbi:TRAP transporter small permease [Arenibaculum pallidiluteum]|uniref:TRAP transporter small permease n=1 Tax=Arenibaculum pallidiluteum TaxID=2812559 RepID=UPI001A96B831|nr:TRAP transporter small permease [Arenibaculum pallidiluteum]
MGLGGDAPEAGSGIARPRDALARFVWLCAVLGVASLVVAILLTVADIVWRRVVGGAFVDTADITRLCLVTAASASIPYGFIRGTHVSVDLLVERFPPRLQTAMEVATSLAGAVFFAFLAWLAWQSAAIHLAYGDTTLNLRLPVVLYDAIFLAGLGLAILACLWRAGLALRTGSATHEEPFG